MSVSGHLDAILSHRYGTTAVPCIAGWAKNDVKDGSRPVLEVIIDDVLVGLIVADLPRRDLLAAGIGDGCFGFRYPIPARYLDGAHHSVGVKVRDSDDFLQGTKSFEMAGLGGKIAICAIIKNEARYILEWFCHHRQMKVDHFFIYDNQSTDDSRYILAELEATGYVTRVYWPSAGWSNPQVSAYQDCLQRLDSSYEWVGFLDLDEFFNPLQGTSLRDVLSLHQGADAVAFNWRVFGSAGETKYYNRPVTERFRFRASDEFHANRLFKTFAKPQSVVLARVHYVQLSKGIYVTSGGRSVEPGKGGTDVPDYTTASINHYFVKSREEWMIKRSRGMADKSENNTDRIRPESHFQDHDANDVLDDSLSALRNDLRFELALTRKLGPFCFKNCPD